MRYLCLVCVLSLAGCVPVMFGIWTGEQVRKRIDEALFLGGRDKGPFLAAFGADIFFDDQRKNAENASRFVPTGHVPHGVANKGQ